MSDKQDIDWAACFARAYCFWATDNTVDREMLAFTDGFEAAKRAAISEAAKPQPDQPAQEDK